VRWQRKSERSEISRSGGILCGTDAKNVYYHSLAPFASTESTEDTEEIIHDGPLQRNADKAFFDTDLHEIDTNSGQVGWASAHADFFLDTDLHGFDLVIPARSADYEPQTTTSQPRNTRNTRKLNLLPQRTPGTQRKSSMMAHLTSRFTKPASRTPNHEIREIRGN